MPILQSTISSSAQIHLHPAFFVFHYPSLIPLFLSLHYLPSRLSNRFIPLSPCSRSLCNYFVLVCIPVTIPPCRFVSHLSLSRFIVCVCVTHTRSSAILLILLSRRRHAPMDSPLLHRLLLPLCFFILYVSLSSNFPSRVPAPLFSSPLSVFLINSSPPTSLTLSPYSLSIQLRIGGLHCASQCWLNAPAGPAMPSVVSC